MAAGLERIIVQLGIEYIFPSDLANMFLFQELEKRTFLQTKWPIWCLRALPASGQDKLEGLRALGKEGLCCPAKLATTHTHPSGWWWLLAAFLAVEGQPGC